MISLNHWSANDDKVNVDYVRGSHQKTQVCQTNLTKSSLQSILRRCWSWGKQQQKKKKKKKTSTRHANKTIGVLAAGAAAVAVHLGSADGVDTDTDTDTDTAMEWSAEKQIAEGSKHGCKHTLAQDRAPVWSHHDDSLGPGFESPESQCSRCICVST